MCLDHECPTKKDWGKDKKGKKGKKKKETKKVIKKTSKSTFKKSKRVGVYKTTRKKKIHRKRKS